MTREILGRPVTGTKPYHRPPRTEQWAPERFIELLDAVLAVPGVEAVKWNQYTPYFNDGEPCEFGIGEAYVRITGQDEEAGDNEDGFIGSYEMANYDRDIRRTIAKAEYTGVFPAYDALASAMEHFEEFLSESFGDHAEITATKSGFAIEQYDHD